MSTSCIAFKALEPYKKPEQHVYKLNANPNLWTSSFTSFNAFFNQALFLQIIEPLF